VSQTVAAYGFADAVADHKALTEALARLLGHGGRSLLARVVSGSLRFRLLRGRPSHEKLYLLIITMWRATASTRSPLCPTAPYAMLGLSQSTIG
jgi:hypothetical protein